MKAIRQVNLCIADFTFNIFTDDDGISMHFDKGFDDFFMKQMGSCDVSIKVHAHLPLELLDCPVVYQAPGMIGVNSFTWRIHKYFKNYFIIAYRPGEVNSVPHYIAFFNEKGNRWDIYTQPIGKKGSNEIVEPLAYPILHLILYYLSTSHDGLLIQASGVFDGKKGYVFTGAPGSGKTTISRMWKQSGAYVIDDQQLLVRYYNGKMYMYNIPAPHTDHPKKAAIDNIFLIKPSKVNYKRKLIGQTALSRFVELCYQHNYDKKLIDKLQVFASEIQRNVPLSELGFVPESTVIEMIHRNDSSDWQ